MVFSGVWCDVLYRFVVVDIDRYGQYQRKYAYQLQQSVKARHTKHTPINTINLH